MNSYKVIKGRIKHKRIGETVLLTDEEAKAYGAEYVQPLEVQEAKVVEKPKRRTVKKTTKQIKKAPVTK